MNEANSVSLMGTLYCYVSKTLLYSCISSIVLYLELLMVLFQ